MLRKNDEPHAAAGGLSELAKNPALKNKIHLEGAVVPLVTLVKDGTDASKLQAAAALCNLAADNTVNQHSIAREGGIAPLIELVKSGNDVQKEQATAALANIAAYNTENQIAVATASCVPLLVKLAKDGTDGQKQQAARTLGLLAWKHTSNQSVVARAGGIPPLVELVDSGSEASKMNAAMALSYLTYSTAWRWWQPELLVDADNRVAVARAGGILPLIELVEDATADDSQEHAAAALWNLATIATNAVSIVQHGAIQSLIRLLRCGGTVGVQRMAVGALKELARANANNKHLVILALLAVDEFVRSVADTALGEPATETSKVVLDLVRHTMGDRAGVLILVNLVQSEADGANAAQYLAFLAYVAFEPPLSIAASAELALFTTSNSNRTWPEASRTAFFTANNRITYTRQRNREQYLSEIHMMMDHASDIIFNLRREAARAMTPAHNGFVHRFVWYIEFKVRCAYSDMTELLGIGMTRRRARY